MEIDQDIQRGLRSIFLIKCLVKSQGSRPGDAKTLVLLSKTKPFYSVDQDIQRELMSIFLIRYLLAEGIRPGEIQRGLMSIFLIKYLSKA